MVEPVAVAELRDVGVDQPKLVTLHLGIAIGNRTLSETKGFHLGPGQRDASLEHLVYGVFIARAPVLGDGFRLVERGILGTRHQISPACSSARSTAFCDVSEGQVIGSLSRSEEHTSELQSLMRISYAVFCLKKKTTTNKTNTTEP